MSFRVRPLSALLVGSLAAGCGGGHDATEKQLEQLSAQVNQLKAAQEDLTERLERAELALKARNEGAARSAQGAPAARAPEGDRPALDVVRLEPRHDPSLESDDPDAETPRPVVRASGNAGVIQDTTSGKVLLDDRGAADAAPKKKPSAFAPGAAKGGATKAGTSPAGEKKP